MSINSHGPNFKVVKDGQYPYCDISEAILDGWIPFGFAIDPKSNGSGYVVTMWKPPRATLYQKLEGLSDVEMEEVNRQMGI